MERKLRRAGPAAWGSVTMTSSGKLRVRVYVSQAELPLEGATVVVTQRDGAGKYRLLSIQATDSSGLIRPVEISTPAAGESAHPAQGGQPVFSVCSVWAEHPDYVMLQVNGVQVFSGVETVQEMELIPLVEGESSLQHRDVRDISAQSL